MAGAESDVELPADIADEPPPLCEESDGDDVELPADVDWDAESGPGSDHDVPPPSSPFSPEGGVELPTPAVGHQICKCRRNCSSSIAEQVLEDLRSHRKLKFTERQAWQFDRVRRTLCGDDGEIKDGKTTWSIPQAHGPGSTSVEVCLSFWMHAHAIGPARKVVAGGHISEPPKKKHVPSVNAVHQWLRADSWFLRVYTDIAEPMADTQGGSEVPTSDMDELALVDVQITRSG